VFAGSLLFSMRWQQDSTVKYIVSKNLEGKFLKTENLGGMFTKFKLDAMLGTIGTLIVKN
jgi:hypothetical protein